ncbi:hypothetical protein C1D09_024275 [Mesorhizobium intechi]|nr:hypothetical protein C1D09_024275 [Mesorhizobium intechi]
MPIRFWWRTSCQRSSPQSPKTKQHASGCEPRTGRLGSQQFHKPVLVGRLALWTRNRDTRVVTIAILLIETCGAFLVTATAHYGGLLVYELGVNVAKTAIAD